MDTTQTDKQCGCCGQVLWRSPIGSSEKGQLRVGARGKASGSGGMNLRICEDESIRGGKAGEMNGLECCPK